jgi:hypothetical protein
MRALEEALTQEAGKTRRLSRTRQKLKRAGVRQTLADLALKPQPSIGFFKLIEFGMADMSAESLVIKYRTELSLAVRRQNVRCRKDQRPTCSLSRRNLEFRSQRVSPR